MELGTRVQTSFEMAKMLVLHIKALGIFCAALPFELDVCVTLEGMGWTLWQRQQERVSIVF